MSKSLKIKGKSVIHYSNRRTLYVIDDKGEKISLEKFIISNLKGDLPLLMANADNRFGAAERETQEGNQVVLYDGGGKYGCGLKSYDILEHGIEIEINIKMSKK